jgi:galactose-1-phosphate uridylyltransferase
VRERFQQALNHYDEYGECMFCQSLEEEIADRQRVVLLTEHFVALELYASPTPFCTPLYPRRHMASFGDISAAEIADLARVLRTVLAKLYHGLGNPDFNFTIRSAPAEYVGVKALPLVCQHHPASNPHGGLRTGIWNVYQHCLARSRGGVPAKCESRTGGRSELIL